MTMVMMMVVTIGLYAKTNDDRK